MQNISRFLKFIPINTVMKILLVVFLFSGYAYSEKPVCKDWILIASDWKKNANNIKKLAVKDPYCKTFSYKEWVGKYQKLIKAEEQFLKNLNQCLKIGNLPIKLVKAILTKIHSYSPKK